MKKRQYQYKNNYSPSKETRDKMRLARLGKSLSKKARDKLRKNAKTNPNYGMKGKHHSEESKLKMSESRKGKKLSEKHKITLRKTHIRYWKGKTRSEETKNKISDKLKGHKNSEHAKQKMRIHRAKQIFPMKDTLIELKIQGFLKELNIEFLPHYYCKEIEHAYQCDIFIPSLNLVIECDGDYWHGNTKTRFKGKQISEIVKKQIEEDNIRTQELQDKGYRVIRLWESEINKMNIQDLNNKILRVAS